MNISWLATIFSLIGVALNAKKHRASWPFWFVANLLWAWVGIESHNSALAVLQTIYAVFSVYGWFQWAPKPQAKAVLVYQQESTVGTTPVENDQPAGPRGRCHCEICEPPKKVSRFTIETTDPDGFIAHLEAASAEVATWPEWKRNLLGWARTWDNVDPEKFKREYISEFPPPNRCGIVPRTPGYARCTRVEGHDGPCANPLETKRITVNGKSCIVQSTHISFSDVLSFANQTGDAKTVKTVYPNGDRSYTTLGGKIEVVDDMAVSVSE